VRDKFSLPYASVKVGYAPPDEPTVMPARSLMIIISLYGRGIVSLTPDFTINGVIYVSTIPPFLEVLFYEMAHALLLTNGGLHRYLTDQTPLH
jgi:hypothetical protein